jgi:site-specific recombinase XerD
MERRNLDLLMKCYGEASGLAPKLCHCHIWKHTCACDLLDLGFGISDVQDHLGHVNVQSTAIYAEITNRRRQQMAEQVKDTWR